MKAEVVLDLQFGSTGKGLVCAHLAEQRPFDGAVCAWGPNSGHTAYIKAGGDLEAQVVHTVLPLSGAVPGGPRHLFLAPGSVVDPPSLWKDAESISLLREGPVHVYIHEHAAVVNEDCRKAEQAYAFKIGSTQKGTGAAVIRKILRSEQDAVASAHIPELVGTCEDRVITHVLSAQEWEDALYSCDRVLVEGSQGFSLGINSGFWPHCTSRECSLAQILSDCLIAPSRVDRVHGVARTYPIRVANRYDEKGHQIGYSGPGYADQQEISWGDVGVPVERTTVTRLPRRVFTFSRQQVADALRRNDVTDFYLTFCNYLDPDPVWSLRKAEQILSWVGVESAHLGYGPRGSDFLRYRVGETSAVESVTFIRAIKEERPSLFADYGKQYDEPPIKDPADDFETREVDDERFD